MSEVTLSKQSTRVARCLTLPVEFPFGASPGQGSAFNRLTLARNGKQQPVVRGSSLAGVLRRCCKECCTELELNTLFGCALDGDSGQRSAVDVADVVVDVGKGQLERVRTHNLINRHTGTVIDKGLFELEALPPGTRAAIVLWLVVEEATAGLADRVVQHLVDAVTRGLIVGGRSKRGVGLMRLRTGASAELREYALSRLESRAAYTSDYRTWLETGSLPGNGKKMTASSSMQVPGSASEVSVRFRIPRGQDLLIGGGTPDKSDTEPQSVVNYDGERRWLLPGSSLRGPVRGWITRLAAREGKVIDDKYQTYSSAKNIQADDLAWAFVDKNYRTSRKPIPPNNLGPVTSLFGSLNGAGRLTIFDGLSARACSADDVQLRMHVAVDRLTGGAIEGRLFDNRVVIGADESPVEFEVTCHLRNATDDDRRWLGQTFQAIHLGVLRIGSGKAAGRLELCLEPNQTPADYLKSKSMDPAPPANGGAR